MRIVSATDLPALVGEEMGVSEWVLVDQAMIDGFAAVCGDRQWIHVDVERATREVGGTIAHGFLSLSLLSVMAQDVFRVEGTISAINYGLDRVRFTGFVPAGATIRLRQTLLSVEVKASGHLVTTRNTVEVAGSDRPALVADWLVLFRFA